VKAYVGAKISLPLKELTKYFSMTHYLSFFFPLGVHPSKDACWAEGSSVKSKVYFSSI
jgi:hypothetical protein